MNKVIPVFTQAVILVICHKLKTIFFFSSIVKQAIIAVYFTLKSLNQPVLNNEGKVACP